MEYDFKVYVTSVPISLVLWTAARRLLEVTWRRLLEVADGRTVVDGPLVHEFDPIYLLDLNLYYDPLVHESDPTHLFW